MIFSSLWSYHWLNQSKFKAMLRPPQKVAWPPRSPSQRSTDQDLQNLCFKCCFSYKAPTISSLLRSLITYVHIRVTFLTFLITKVSFHQLECNLWQKCSYILISLHKFLSLFAKSKSKCLNMDRFNFDCSVCIFVFINYII